MQDLTRRTFVKFLSGAPFTSLFRFPKKYKFPPGMVGFWTVLDAGSKLDVGDIVCLDKHCKFTVFGKYYGEIISNYKSLVFIGPVNSSTKECMYLQKSYSSDNANKCIVNGQWEKDDE